MIKQPNSLKREAPSEWEGLAMRERSILSVRSEYFQSVIVDTLHLNPHEQKVLHMSPCNRHRAPHVVDGQMENFAPVVARLTGK